MWTCPYCAVVLERDGDGWTCPDCGCHTRYPDQDACTRDEWLERMRVEDLVDELEAAVDDLTRIFTASSSARATTRACGIAVTLEDDPRDMDDEQTLDAWGMDRARAIRALEIDHGGPQGGTRRVGGRFRLHAAGRFRALLERRDVVFSGRH